MKAQISSPTTRKLKIKKNDIVKVITGSDRGKTGKVLQVYPKTMRIMVEGINLRKRHVKPSQTNAQGGVISKERAIHYSNVSLSEAAAASATKTAKAGKTKKASAKAAAK